MDAARPNPLPTLAPEDEAVLTAYLAANQDIAALTKGPGARTVIAALQWLSKPDIAAYIAAFHTQQSQHNLATIAAALNTALRTAADPTEIRRTATTLIRALHSTRPTRLSPPRGLGGFPTRPHSPTPDRHPRAHREPANISLSPAAPHPHAASPIHPLTPPPLHPPPPRPSLSEALAILGIPELTDEEEDALEDAELDALDDEDEHDQDFDSEHTNTS